MKDLLRNGRRKGGVEMIYGPRETKLGALTLDLSQATIEIPNNLPCLTDLCVEPRGFGAEVVRFEQEIWLRFEENCLVRLTLLSSENLRQIAESLVNEATKRETECH